MILTRIASTMAAIRARLLNDEVIKKLLFYDGNDALLIDEDISLNEFDIDKYITLRPIFEFENKENYDQNSMINIYMTQAMPEEETKNIDCVIQINIVCNQDVWGLANDKIRPIEIVNAIERLVNNQKFTASNRMVLNTITDLIISKKMFGYAMLFDLTDGSGEIENF